MYVSIKVAGASHKSSFGDSGLMTVFRRFQYVFVDRHTNSAYHYYADTDLQDHNTLEQYRIPNNGKIQQVLKGRADDRSELPLTELPPSPSPPSPEAIVVVSQSTVAC